MGADVVKEFIEAIKEPPQDNTRAYSAIVSRIDDEGTVWVHLAGSEKETPTALVASEVERGDVVNVEWRNNRLYVANNVSNPAAGYFTTQGAVDFVASLEGQDVSVNSITAATGYIDDLYSKNITTENIKATNGYIQHLVAEDITAESIVADHADISDLKADKADIDLLNVDVAWIEQGNIKKAEVFDENVFDLSGNRATLSRIDASKINVANLRADNLVVRRINGQPVVGGYTLISNTSPDYEHKNPQALGWYEFVNAQWVLSTDTTVDMTKAYYQEGNEVSLYDQAYIDGLENDLQQQIDGAVETFTGTVVPTLVNWPYTDWYDTSVTPVHDERAKHVGDIYYVVNSALDQNGYCYRFTFDNTQHTYSWVLIKDSDVTKALSDISELQTFESETTSWIDETDEGLETIRTNHTALSGRVDDVEATANAALPATTFETFESTTFTDLVDEVDEQSTTMTNMTTRLGLNADGTASSTDIVSKESALEQTVDGISTRVGKTEMHLAGMYATSSTAAGTAAKVATIVPTLSNYELAKGAIVTVKFVNNNTSAAPTLNLNNTGAKTIKTYANGNLTPAEAHWKAGSTFTFTYNGTNWLMQDSTASVRMNTAETSITQTADSIVSLASNTSTYTKPDGTTGTNAMASAISQNADNISLKVSKNDVINQINVSTEGAQISASKVDIAGAAIFSNYATKTEAQGYADTAEANAKADIPTNISELTNDSGYQTSSDVSTAITNGVSGKADKTDAASEEQYIYISKASGTSSVSGTTTWVNSSDDLQNTWTTKRPTYNTSYPVLFIAKQKKTVSGTVTCTTPIKDDTTTIIDGGHITTGTIDASRVNVSNLTVGSFGSEELKTGGKNLLSGTLIMLNGGGTHASHTFRLSGSGALSSTWFASENMPAPGLYRVLRTTNNTSSTARGGFAQDNVPINIQSGTYVTMSAWVRASVDNVSFQFQPFWYNNANPYSPVGSGGTVTISRTWKYYTLTVKTTTNITPKCSAGYCYATLPAGAFFDVTGLKLEVGSVATEFTDDTEFDGANLCAPGSDLEFNIDNLLPGSGFTAGGIAEGKRCSYVNGELGVAKYLHSGINLTPQPNEFFTISCEMRLSNYTAGTTNPYVTLYFVGTSNNSSGAWKSAPILITTVDGIQKHLANAGEFPAQDLNGKGWVKVVSIGRYENVTFNEAFSIAAIFARDFTGKLCVRNFKVERGYKASPWTPNGDSRVATNYIYASSTGLRIASANPATQNQRIVLTSSQTSMYDAGNIERLRLNSGTGVLVGRPTAGHTIVNDTGLDVYASDGTTVSGYFHGETARIGRGDRGRVDIASTGIDMYGYNANASTPNQNLCHVGFDSGNAASGTAIAPFYTLGTRLTSIGKGNYSVVEGYNGEASGFGSYAGTYGTAVGGGSFARGLNSRANGAYQTVIGVNNVLNGTADRYASSDKAFIIGNGTSASSRSNAFDVQWNGVVHAAGGIFVEGHSSVIGSILTKNGTKSIASGSNDYVSTGVTISLPAGSWAVTYSVSYPGNSTGNRAAVLYYDGTKITCSECKMAPVSNAERVLNGTMFVENPTSSNKSATVYTWSTATAALTATVYMRAIRIA